MTYTPSEDRILPAPSHLHVKIKNSCAIALRAAYLHGPYTLHVSAYPSTFDPNKKVEFPKRDGVPQFEPNLKAGGTWTARLTVPEHIREAGASSTQEGPKQVTWIIEVASQILFSQSASVSYELLVARDEKSLDLGFTAITGNTQGTPGQVQDHQQGIRSHRAAHPAQPKEVYSRAIKLVVDDTTSLWNTPALPKSPHDGPSRRRSKDGNEPQPELPVKQKKIHLVVLTHGLHSNLGADMLYMKESIDATVKQAREDRRRRREEEKRSKLGKEKDSTDTSTAPLSGGQESMPTEEEDEDDEEVIVRGFDGNVIRTERGIQYLGKRLAKHVLRMTYPDQPFLPVKKKMSQKISGSFSPAKSKATDSIPGESSTSSTHPRHHEHDRAYKFTSISFIGHSLGGLVQTYAIAYIHKHSPLFFENIKPINFIAMASPFLGLSNENPMYVRFALDFGLVGRTGQDLGLTWRAPTIARNGWTAMVSGLGNQSQKGRDSGDPGAKPLLRILPTGPAHTVLRMFRNRTLYSNVVNDGIVPLRTSCLLFLDWRGLGRVEKARRENGLIGTVAGWGWGQLTGQNSSPNPSRIAFSDDEIEGIESPPVRGDATTVPQPGADVTNEDDEAQAQAATEPGAHQFLSHSDPSSRPGSPQGNQSTIMTLWGYIRPSGKHTAKDKKMFKRSQTVQMGQEQADAGSSEMASSENEGQPRKRPGATRGDSYLNDSTNVSAPPKTTIFESAGDILDPPVPPASWIIDPSTRARTIFHDRIYHPEDIPPPPAKRPKLGRSFSSENSANSQGTATSENSVEEGSMRVEEKIARAYHKDLSWRKVLVRLEPDAHNNLIVRRMFANAYGWPVVKHMCDTHFADTYSAITRDENEPAHDRAKGLEEPVKEDGEHVKGQSDSHPPVERTASELREVADELAPLAESTHLQHRMHAGHSLRRQDSSQWDDAYFEGTSDEDDEEQDDRNAIQKYFQPQSPRDRPGSPTSPEGFGTSEADIADFLSASRPKSVDGHRGLGISPPQSPAHSREPDSLESMGGMMADRGRQPSTPRPSAGAMIDLGLRMSRDVNSPSSPQKGRARSGSGGVAEQVARLSLAKDHNQPS